MAGAIGLDRTGPNYDRFDVPHDRVVLSQQMFLRLRYAYGRSFEAVEFAYREERTGSNQPPAHIEVSRDESDALAHLGRDEHESGRLRKHVLEPAAEPVIGEQS